MLILSVMLLFGLAHAVTINATTYQHLDSVTGRGLTCNRCPPGFHMLAHCTANQQTRCVPCKSNHFTQCWNYLSKCLYCSSCDDDQIVKTECSPLHDRECECKEGYYWDSHFCLKHTECPPGYGIKYKGTAHKNAECEKCPHGSYSRGSSVQATCVEHTDCESVGMQVVFRGTGWHENLCASCDELKTGGGFQLLRGILPDFFAHQRMHKKRLFRFVNKLLPAGEKKQLGDIKSPHVQNILQHHIRKWVKDAGDEMLKKLPEMLKSSNLHNAADKLEKKLRKVEASYQCD